MAKGTKKVCEIYLVEKRLRSAYSANMGLFPRQKYQEKLIARRVDDASATVMSAIREEVDYANVHLFDVEIGKKPGGIAAGDFLERVGNDAWRKLMKITLEDVCLGTLVRFNPEASKGLSKHEMKYAGYGNKPSRIIDPNHLHIAFERIGVQLEHSELPPEAQVLQQAA